MQECNYCGRQIEFRYVDGVCRPIHVEGGGWCDGYAAGVQHGHWQSAILVSEHADQNFCRATRCPKCRASVFFVRHNGGSVWFDELGWPWPKHGCFDHEPRIMTILREYPGDQDEGALLGMVVRSSVFADASFADTLLAIQCSLRTQLCVALKGRWGHLNGHLLAVTLDPSGREVEHLLDEKGTELPLINHWINPADLGLPPDWVMVNGDHVSPPLKLPPPPKPPLPPKLPPVQKMTQTVVQAPRRPDPQPKPKKPYGMKQCPHCPSQVRADRLEKHVRKIHGAGVAQVYVKGSRIPANRRRSLMF